MQIEAHKISDAEATFTITITAEEVEQFYQGAYNKLKHRIRVPGFRKGKVPQDIAERQLGDAALKKQAIADLADYAMQKYTAQLDPKPVSAPEIEVRNFERGKEATFIGKYETLAPIKLGTYTKIEITEDILLVDEKSLAEELEHIRQSKALLYTREEGESQKDDIAEIEITIRHNNKALVKKRKGHLKLDNPTALLPGLSAKVIGMRSGEEKSFALEIADDYENRDYAGKKLDIDLKLLDCRYLKPPTLDDDFAQDQGDFKSLAEYKQKIKNQLLQVGNTSLQEKSKGLLLDQIVANTECHVPRSWIEREVKQRQHKISHEIGHQLGKKHASMEEIARLIGKSSAEIEKDIRDSCENFLRKYLVLQELVKVLNKEVSQEEFEAAVRLECKPEIAEKILESTEKSEAIQNMEWELRNRLLHKAVLDHLYRISKIKSGKKISWTDFRAMVQREQ